MKNNLYTLLKADEKQVRKIVTKSLKENGYSPIIHDDFIYAEGTVPVLLIAHYDTYADSPRFIHNNKGVLSGRKSGKPHQLGADDRAGIYAILETIPKHHCHVLFTGGEEHGGIGATAFTKSGIKPDVNYCLQFDRRGTNDAVYYWTENPEFEKFIESHGWEKAEGSFTDICEVCPYLGVMGVNLSIGYVNEHTTSEVLDTEVMNTNIKRIPELLDGEKYEYMEMEWNYPSWYRGTFYGGYDYDYDSYYRSSYSYEYYIEFIGDEGEEDADIVVADNYEEAIGLFLIRYSNLTYKHIISCINLDVTEEKKHGEN